MENDKKTSEELLTDERRELEKLRRYKNNRLKVHLISVIISSALLAVAVIVVIAAKMCGR